jgi:hypothetical protein
MPKPGNNPRRVESMTNVGFEGYLTHIKHSPLSEGQKIDVED